MYIHTKETEYIRILVLYGYISIKYNVDMLTVDIFLDLFRSDFILKLIVNRTAVVMATAFL